MNRIDRLLGLILFLQSRRYATAADMAGHFGLSVRTIYRDIRALGEAGVPILAEAGVGYSLLKGYHLPPVNFTEEEAGALVTGGLLFRRHSGEALSGHMGAALQKILAVLPAARKSEIRRLRRGMASIAETAIPEQADLALLQRALGSRRVLRFEYQGYGKTAAERREVEPRGLLFYLGRWHLIAWCRLRRDFRDFRTDRMREVEMPGEVFAPGEEFDPAAYVREHMPTPELRARVRFDAGELDRAKREWWMGVVGEEPEAGGAVLTLAAVELGSLAAWLLSFGASATVVEPPRLRGLLVERADAAAAHHRASGVSDPSES